MEVNTSVAYYTTFKSQKEKHFVRKEKVFGQFMTPAEVAGFIVSFAIQSLEYKPKLAIDPACGDGIFLRELVRAGVPHIVGIDIDPEVSESIPPDIKSQPNVELIIPQDGLEDSRYEGKADIVVGNPPFSAKYGRIKDTRLSNFELGKQKTSQAIEILFLEKFIRLAKNGGVIGIILPFGIFANLPLRDVREFILKNTEVLAVVSLPRFIFRSVSNTSSKTCILFARKRNSPNTKEVYMSIVNRIEELPLLLDRKEHESPMAKFVKLEDHILYPEYYLLFSELPKTSYPTMKLGDLVDISCGRTEYGEKRKFVEKGIPFISAKTVTQLGIDFSRDRKFVEPGSEMDKKSARVKVGDVVFVRVGVGCIGRAAVITDENDLGVVDDWSYILRTKRNTISPYFLVFYLQSNFVRSLIKKLSRGVGTVTLPQALLKQIRIPIPEKEIERKLKKIYLEMVNARRKGKTILAKKKFEEGLSLLKKEVFQE